MERSILLYYKNILFTKIEYQNKKGEFIMKIQVGQNIRFLRHKRKVSQEDLAETMGVTVQAISKWETGKANPDLMLLPKLAEYLKPGGKLVFSWDNPLMQCIISENEKHSLYRSYVEEEEILFSNNGETFHLHNWKLSTYLNCLAKHGFLIEQVIEESDYNENEANIFQEGKFYSAGRARFLNTAFIIKARKL